MKKLSKFNVTYLTGNIRRFCALSYSRCALLGLMLLGIISCETVVEVDIPREAPKLVTNSFIGAGEPVAVRVSRSQSVLDNANIHFIKGAEVVLLEEGTVVATLEENSEPEGLYTASFAPSAGKNYTLQVSKSGYETIEAVASIPKPIPIQEIDYDTTMFSSTYQDGDTTIVERRVSVEEIRLTFVDPPNERNYYEVAVSRYFVRPVYQYDEWGNLVFDSLNMPVVIDSVQELYPIDLLSDDPLLTGNSDFLEDDGSAYGAYFTFPDDLLEGKRYTLRLRPTNNYYSRTEEENQYVVFLRTISEAQYQYFVSNELQYNNEGNPFAEPAQVYNNIENGFGIFAGHSSDQVVLNLE